MLIRGIAVFLVPQESIFRRPEGRVSGFKNMHTRLVEGTCDGVVVITESQWQALGGDAAKQQALVAQAVAAAVEAAQQHKGGFTAAAAPVSTASTPAATPLSLSGDSGSNSGETRAVSSSTAAPTTTTTTTTTTSSPQHPQPASKGPQLKGPLPAVPGPTTQPASCSGSSGGAVLNRPIRRPPGA